MENLKEKVVIELELPVALVELSKIKTDALGIEFDEYVRYLIIRDLEDFVPFFDDEEVDELEEDIEELGN